MIVADANLIVYLLLPGQFTDLALAALERDADWCVPALWRSEVCSALRGHVRAGDVDIEEAIEMLHDAEERFHSGEIDFDMGRALYLSHHSDVSTYDCEYIAAAETIDVRVVTADRRVARAFPERAVLLEVFANGG